MDKKFKKSQILLLSLLAVLLIITPLLSSSLRPTFIYFIINILIIAVGADSGLLSSFSRPSEDKKRSVSAAPKPVTASEASPADKMVDPASTQKKVVRVVEKSASEKIVRPVKMNKVKKCPSTPSLFFIEGRERETEAAAVHEGVAEEYRDEEDQEEVGLTGPELFMKAETFIGNFYKQLKMQREDSWKKIHDLYQKAF